MAGHIGAVREMLAKLVAFDTTSRNSNLDLIEFVRNYLEVNGIRCHLTFNAEGNKANLFATVGPDERTGGIVLSGHTDVVPVDGQEWATDPFTVVERDGRLYGRGTCDMKGFVAIVLALVPEFLRRDLAVPIHLALTYDEEVDCSGAAQLVKTIAEAGYAPSAVIVGEPTGMSVLNGHKGHYAYRTTVIGREAHSSLSHRGVSAIAVANRLIGRLLDFAERAKEGVDPDNGFDPPFPTLNVGVIAGGTAMNIVPRRCSFDWDWRPLPGQDVERAYRYLQGLAARLLPQLRAIAPEADIITEQTLNGPPLASDQGSAAESLVMALVGTNQSIKAAYGTEAPLYQRAHMPVVVCGPGSIDQAHKPDEFIDVKQIEACVSMMFTLLDRISAVHI